MYTAPDWQHLSGWPVWLRSSARKGAQQTRTTSTTSTVTLAARVSSLCSSRAEAWDRRDLVEARRLERWLASWGTGGGGREEGVPHLVGGGADGGRAGEAGGLAGLGWHLEAGLAAVDRADLQGWSQFQWRQETPTEFLLVEQVEFLLVLTELSLAEGTPCVGSHRDKYNLASGQYLGWQTCCEDPHIGEADGQERQQVEDKDQED